MSKQRHYDFGLRALKTLLVSAGALKRQALTEMTTSGDAEIEGAVLEQVEKNVLIEGACQNVVPKLVASDLEVFTDILMEVFPGSNVAEMEDEALREILLDVCREQHLVAGDNWIQKILQLKQVLEMRHGVMLVGPVGTGKSTALKCLMLALERLDGIKGDTYIIDAKAMDKDALYGTLDGTTMEWQDGVFTSLLRIVVEGARGEKDRRHWIVFDGDVDPEWAENLNSVLDDNKLLTLPSGERINIPPNIRIIIEVDSLEEATPATVSRCGMVWFSDDVMSTEMCLEHLMSGLLYKDINGGQTVSDAQHQFAQSIKSLVQYDANGRASLVSEAIDFALQQEHIMKQSRSQLLTPLVSLLHKGIELAIEYNETHPDFHMSDDHMEKFSQRWLLFSLLWSFGGSANWSTRCSLGDMLCTLGAVELPDSESNLIDYRVRLSDGEFEHWAMSVPRSEIESHKVTSTDVVITTTDTVRHAEVLGAWLNSRKPLILCGPPGSGKTMTLTNVLQSLQGITLASLNFSSGTTPEIILKTFSQYCAYVRRGKSIVLEPMETFGADTWLVVFCDEINLPKKDAYGTQRVIMFMRQLVEQGGFWRDDNVWVKINRIQFVGACNPPTDAGREEMSLRWLRHAPLLLVDFPARESLMQIYRTFNGGIMKLFPNLKGQTDALTEAMVDLYTANQIKFTPDIQPQYFFSPRELSRWVRGIYEAVHDLDVLTNEDLVRIWAHEALRLFSDRLVTEQEKQWCEEKVDEVARTYFAGVDHEVALERPLFYSSWLTKDTRRINRDELKTFLAARLRVFYEEELDVPLVVFDEVLEHVLRIDRVLRQPMGHCLLVGDSGVGKTVLSKFVSWMNGLSIFQIKAHSRYGLHEFNEDLRAVMKRVGVEGEKVCFIFDEANALDSGFLEAMNALLASGEVPGLFEGDDYAALMSACRDSASRDGLIIDQEEELWRRFTSLVQRNLHVVFTMNPSGGDWKNRSTASPALFNRCVVDWFGTWGAKAKGEVGKEFTMRLDIGDAESVGGAWGIGEGEEMMQLVEAAFDRNGSGGFRQAVVAALVDIHETTKKVAEESATGASRTFLSPRDYLALIQNFVTCVNDRRSKVEDEQLHINAGLEKLKQTQDNVAELKLGLGKKTVELREKESLANAKLQQMVADQNVAEKRKEEAERMGKEVDEQQVEISKRKADAQRDLDEAEPALIAAQASVKSIKKRDLDEVRNMARPPDKVRLTLECVSIMMGGKTDWPEIRKMLSKSDFIPNIINFDANRLSERQIKAVETQYIVGNDELNAESVMRSSKACGPLFKWAESQIKFSSVYNRVQPLREEVEQLEIEASKAKQEKDRIDTEVAELESKISQYKADYATLIRDVEVLKETMETVKTKVSRAESLLKSLSQESERWEKSSSGFKHILQSIIGDGLLLASFLTYFGYFDFKTRIGLMQKWRNTLDVIGINYREELSMVESLSKASIRIEWQEQGLPSDSLSMENGVILDHCVRFPLIIDPSGQAIEFVQNKYKNSKIQKTSFLDKAFMKTLASAVRFGTTLLVENVESIDPVLNPILNREIQKTGGRALVRIGSEEVDYSPSFSIILSTKNPAAKLTPDLCSRVTLVNFTVTPASLQSQSLSLILRREKPEIERQRIEVLKLQGEQNVKLRSLEDQMLAKISAVEGSILDDDRVVEGMETLMKEGAQVEEQIAKSAVVMAEVEAAISKFTSLSVACRQIFVLLAAMRNIHFLYEFSSDSFMTVLESVLDETKRVGGEMEDARLENLTTSLFRETVARMCRGLLAEDKFVFVLLLGHILKEGDESYSFRDDASVEDLTGFIYARFGAAFKWQGRGLDSLQAVTENEIKATVPVLLCSAPGHDVSSRVEYMSKVAGHECTSLAMGSEEGFESADKIVSIASKTGKWVLLKNCHLCTEWLSTLVKKLQAQIPHEDFRVFITSEISPKLPTGLLRMSDTIVAEAQTGIKSTLSRFFCNISTDRFGQPEKNRLYLLLGWVHAVIQERLRFVPTGWSESYGFTESDASHALDSIDALIGEASGGKSHIAPEDIPWEAIRVTLSKSIFGGRISNPTDQDALDSLLNSLFISKSFDVDFKLVQTEEPGFIPTLPEKTSKDECFSWIESLPPYNPPTWIGLDSFAEEMRSRSMAKSIIEKVTSLLVSEKDA
uniref:AAA+ ATPase domain-containing protein n=1 Tax=Leptocylindrus danicus TaxID=163516 RepID=A0A7S2LKS4_9STRA